MIQLLEITNEPRRSIDFLLIRLDLSRESQTAIDNDDDLSVLTKRSV